MAHLVIILLKVEGNRQSRYRETDEDRHIIYTQTDIQADPIASPFANHFTANLRGVKDNRTASSDIETASK